MAKIKVEGSYTSTGKYSAKYEMELEDTDTEEYIESLLAKIRKYNKSIDSYIQDEYIQKNM